METMLPPMRVCFVGDDYVCGEGDDDCQGRVSRACSKAKRRGNDLRPYNLGVCGNTSRDIAQRWEKEVVDRLELGGFLILSFGVNDCRLERGEPKVCEEEALLNIDEIVGRAGSQWPMLMVGPPCTRDAALNLRIQSLSDKLQAFCEGQELPFLPLFERTSRSRLYRDDLAQGNGLHPNRAGYGVIYQAVRDWQFWREWTSCRDHLCRGAIGWAGNDAAN